jgi:Flp pilus assembly pilin Flp
MSCLFRVNSCEKMKDERGQGLISYAILLMLMVMACVGGLTVFGSSVVELFNRIGTSFP